MKELFEKMIDKDSFKNKLRLNFHVLTFIERIYYFLYYRSTLTPEERFFFEGALYIPGQMYAAERKGLYDTIIKYRPSHCFEIGTYTGGGSTYFIASAFKKLGAGKLYTLEEYPFLFNLAKKKYQKFLPELLPYVEFILGDTTKSFEKYIGKEVACLFLDGAEEAQQTLDQYNEFSPYFKSGTILMIHDWNTEKTVAVKPLILADNRWEKIMELTKPISVGFVVFKRT